jgi:hypothetical protein
MQIRATFRASGRVVAAMLAVTAVAAVTALSGGSVAGAATTGAHAAQPAKTSGPPFTATGYFYVSKLHGQWYLVTPQGEPFYASMSDTVTPVGDTDRTTGQCPYCQAVAADYPNTAAWATATVARLRSWGFTALGPFSDYSLLGSMMPYTVQLSMGAFNTDLFSSSFATQATNEAQRVAAPLKDDPNVIGYFTDTEPPWEPPGAGTGFTTTLLDTYLALPAGSPGLAVAQSYVGNPNGFLTAAATQYFKVTSEALHAADPNHMDLGVKMEGQEIQPEVFKAAQPYVSVFSVEDYAYQPGFNTLIDSLWPDYVPITANLKEFEKYADKPLMIGEYSAIGATPQTPDTVPGIYPVYPTQEARAAAYAGFIAPLYEAAPWMVGDGWFEYFDEPQGGRPGDAENSDFGLVDVNDQPYSALTGAMSVMHSVTSASAIQTGPACDSWAAGPGGVTCTASMSKASYPLQIVDVNLPNGTVGTPYTGGISAGGGQPAYKVTLSGGPLVKGLKIDPKSGFISGTPKAAGTSTFTVQFTDALGATVSQSGTLSINPAPVPLTVGKVKVPAATVGTPYSLGLVASGGTAPYYWAVKSGTLPAGLALGSDGTISGTPSVAGKFSFTVGVSDSSVFTETSSAAYKLTVKK